MTASDLARAIIPHLTKGERRGIIDAVEHNGDRWGYRYFAPVVRGRKDAIVPGQKIYWNHIAPGGFLSIVGGEIAAQLMGDL